MFTFVPDASKANGAAAAIFRLLDNRPEVDALSTEGIHLNPEKVEGHVKIENVHFRYPSRPGVRVLRDLSIDVPPGTYVALVGPSGCGKSTTVQMLERFYDPLVGKVTLDGVDIKDLNVSSYRNQLALVSQEPVSTGSVAGGSVLTYCDCRPYMLEPSVSTSCSEPTSPPRRSLKMRSSWPARTPTLWVLLEPWETLGLPLLVRLYHVASRWL